MCIREGKVAWALPEQDDTVPRNSSAARREQARALAAAEGITYTQALRRLDEARTATSEADGDETASVVQKSAAGLVEVLAARLREHGQAVDVDHRHAHLPRVLTQ
ncbi:hypothetical protein ACIA8R_31955 [Nonomuraea sp. NPDC051191]|uniref:hypothetical protein n=1 Tax=Nonomuraea sp. NPDC051191 TaxID=3364372 RepID=UPI0037BC2AA1